ncbi:Yip1 family protein [Couchioplanes azureus]|uniref:Yip1 family protein n=1 Tax=Couchioplanes caeruleus TaxID=56438 RepID=UPI00166FF372|nr:Yip1 family protein [Couchioplanes caeruleus]GGQ39347.1 hypothetical protein GCM10010166_02660 [Couchioplanes caeruleus subsp. azureus]
MRIPTFSRQSHTAPETEDRAPVAARADTTDSAAATPAVTGRATPAPDRATPASGRAASEADRTGAIGVVDRKGPDRQGPDRQGPDGKGADGKDPDHTLAERRVAERDARTAGAPVAPGPKPRASLLATLALITGVAGALLVLSGPLLGYGIGVAGLALVLSIAGVRATGRRHVAGKTDALIGMVLALFAIVVGILALTGSLSWLGTDMQPAGDLRQWLDSQFADRF